MALARSSSVTESRSSSVALRNFMAYPIALLQNQCIFSHIQTQERTAMSKSILSRPYFHDEKAAYAFVESQLWADGRPCPHCGVLDESTALKGKSTRIGVCKCRACRKPFTVKVGTIFEASHIKMNIWLQAIFLLSSSKKGISSNQLSRSLGVTLKSAWFMSHRIREAMREGNLDPLGGFGEVVEADETYFGKKA